MRLRLLAAIGGLLCMLAADGAALAQQSANCMQLDGTLRSLTRNSDFRALEQNTQRLRQLASDLQDLESMFVRGGCQRALNAGQDLPQQCRAVARRIIQGRNQYETIARSVETGQGIARQREVVLQDIARFGCSTGSSANMNRREPSLLEQLFGTVGGGFDYGDESIRGEDFYYFGQETVRTVCVRTCDGYYWPVSFSTVTDYLGDDAALCQRQSHGADVSLYYYRNPGQDTEDMINLSGQRYADLENAFRYREEFVPECTPERDTGMGTINIEEFNGQSRAMISLGEANFPMPIRDPRQRAEAAPQIVQAEAIHIPLPRPRPDPGGFTPIVTEITTASVRQVQFGDKTVRIVGPDTPYVQAVEGGS